MPPLRLLYFLTEDWFFCSHFIDRARAAQRAGYEIAIAAREGKDADFIRSCGFRYFPTGLERRSTNPLTELRLLVRVVRIYKEFSPDVVHQAGAKPILYGTLATKLTGIRNILNAPIGMGYVFSSKDRQASLFRPFLKTAYRLLVNPFGSKVVFENSDDLETFVTWDAVRRDDAVLIRGAGVDLQTCEPKYAGNDVPLVVLTARMLEDKGVREFVEAAQQLYQRGVRARFVLVGGADASNPTAIPESTLNEWSGRNGIEWWGWRDDVPAILQQSDIACLPSYREGLPKSLVEAAACGLPIVTTDTVGCREVVEDEKNGFLVPVRSVEPLAEALGRLIADIGLRQQMGAASRQRAIEEFDTRKIAAETLAVYDGFFKGADSGEKFLLNGLRLVLEDWKLILGGFVIGALLATLGWWSMGWPDGGKSWRAMVFVMLGSSLGTIGSLLLVMFNTWVDMIADRETAVSGPTRWYDMLKRTGDVLMSGVLCAAIFLPIMIIGLLVRLTSPGPALYWSDRVGKGNRIFRMPKFRSMRTDTPPMATHLMTDPDRFLTPIGRFLRKTSLDELPQLWCILKGEMSFVGPRPALFNQEDLIALRTKHGVDSLVPGLTGWAQVNGRDELPIPQKVALDEEYLHRRSFRFDLAIVWLTIVNVLSRKGITH